MTILDEVKLFLDALGTLGTITTGYMPASPDIMGTLYEYGGQSPERRFGVVGIGYEKPSFQLVFRGEAFDYDGPRAKAEIAYKAFAAVQPGALGSGVSTVYLTIDPQQGPHPVKEIDSNNRHYVGVNFYATKEPS